MIQGIERLAEETSRMLGLRRTPRIVLSDSVKSPAVFGVVRPTVLLPAGALAEISRKEVAHVLLHEFAHVRRGDLLVHAADLFLRALYWFHPLLWLTRKKLQLLGELCCDARVARVLREKAPEYRTTLLETVRRLVRAPAPGFVGLLEDGNQLLVRLRWLEKGPPRRPVLRLVVVLAVVSFMVSCVLPMAGEGPRGDNSNAGRTEGQGQAVAAGAAKQAQPSTETPARPRDSLSPECKDRLAEIEKLDGGIPITFRDLQRPADEVDSDAAKLIGACQDFLKACGGAEADGPVQATLARMLVARSARERSLRESVARNREANYAENAKKSVEDGKLDRADVEKGLARLASQREAETRGAMREYFAEAAAIAEAAAKACPAGSPGSQTALRALMMIYSEQGRYDDLRKVGERFLESDPAGELRTSAILDIARSFSDEGKHEEAVKYLRGIITKHGSDPEYVLYNNSLFQALSGAGDLEGMEELVGRIREEYPKRLAAMPKDQPYEPFLEERYDQWISNAVFWNGFVRMALGDAQEAIRSFEEYVVEVDALEAKLAGERKSLDPVRRVYRDFRAKPLLEYLKEHHGTEPEASFGDILWAGDRNVLPEELTGKVVAIVVRRPGDKRAAAFLQEIDRFAAERGKDGFVALTLSFFTSGTTASDKENLLGQMRADLSELGVSLPAGFDPDENGQKLIRGIHATVGSSSFVVLDRQGRSAWILQDPRDVDRKLALRVLDRLLAEK